MQHHPKDRTLDYLAQMVEATLPILDKSRLDLETTMRIVNNAIDTLNRSTKG